MTTKQKAKELVAKMKDQFFMERDNVKVLKAKQCALICVDEIYKLNQLKVGRYEGERDIEMYYSYWEDVKQEIEKL